MIDKKLIAQRIREARKAGNVSQELLAEWAGISTTYISQIENGKSENVSMEIMAAIAETLRVSLDYLVFGRVLVEEDNSWAERLLNGCSEREKVVLISMLNSLKEVIIENRE